MADIVTLLPGSLRPDAARTVLRPFIVEDPSTSDCPRTRRVIDRILALDDAGLQDELQVLAAGLEDRHRDVDRLLRSRYEELGGLMTDRAPATPDQGKLIGAYFSEEFSFESVALFNPSVVPHPDQSNLEAAGLRILVSLRGMGEGHISSLVFRTGTWGADGAVTMDDPSKYAVGPRIERRQPALSCRAAASAVSSGRVLKAIAAFGAALWTMFTTVSNNARLFGGSLRPPPITTQS
jgi:hypothetical protein